ncbi:unnamed protein product, partial [Rangifer tarandus platyrhynchus]
KVSTAKRAVYSPRAREILERQQQLIAQSKGRHARSGEIHHERFILEVVAIVAEASDKPGYKRVNYKRNILRVSVIVRKTSGRSSCRLRCRRSWRPRFLSGRNRTRLLA